MQATNKNKTSLIQPSHSTKWQDLYRDSFKSEDELFNFLNIPTKENGKNIVKKELYDKINLKKIIEGL